MPQTPLELKKYVALAWHLRHLRRITREIFEQHNEDPFTNPDSQAALRHLTGTAPPLKCRSTVG